MSTRGIKMFKVLLALAAITVGIVVYPPLAIFVGLVLTVSLIIAIVIS